MGAGTSKITNRAGAGGATNTKLPVRARVSDILTARTTAGLAGQGNLVRPVPGVGAGAVQGTASAGAPRPQVIRTQKNPGHWHNPTGKA